MRRRNPAVSRGRDNVNPVWEGAEGNTPNRDSPLFPDKAPRPSDQCKLQLPKRNLSHQRNLLPDRRNFPDDRDNKVRLQDSHSPSRSLCLSNSLFVPLAKRVRLQLQPQDLGNRV
jgi:hypothetical protein